jgi:hypothetical protein
VHPGDADAPVKLQRWWKAGDPAPIVKSNCARCHLTAGRELTAPAQDFARSVHDLHGMTCSDCHGGNREKDESAHEPEFGFIDTKLSAQMAGWAECHREQAEALKSGPHYWDFSKRVNLKYPVLQRLPRASRRREAAGRILPQDPLAPNSRPKFPDGLPRTAP